MDMDDENTCPWEKTEWIEDTNFIYQLEELGLENSFEVSFRNLCVCLAPTGFPEHPLLQFFDQLENMGRDTKAPFLTVFNATGAYVLQGHRTEALTQKYKGSIVSSDWIIKFSRANRDLFRRQIDILPKQILEEQQLATEVARERERMEAAFVKERERKAATAAREKAEAEYRQTEEWHNSQKCLSELEWFCSKASDEILRQFATYGFTNRPCDYPLRVETDRQKEILRSEIIRRRSRGQGQNPLNPDTKP